MFVDSDDFIHKDFVKNLYAAILAANSDIAICNYYRLNNGIKDVVKQFDLSSDTYITENIRAKSGITIWTGIYKKSLFYDYNLFFPEKLTYEDNGIMKALFLIAKTVFYIDKPLYYYRTDNQSVSRSFNNYSFYDRLQTSEILYNHFQRLGLFEKYPNELRQSFIKYYYITSIIDTFNRFKPIPFDKIRHIQKNIKVFVSKEQLKNAIKKENLKSRLILRLAYYPKPIVNVGYHILSGICTLKSKFR